jgi:MFS family permease
MMRTLLPFYSKKISPESGATLLGTLETTYGIGQIVGATILGRLSDTRGRKFVLLISFLGSAIGYAMTAAATAPWHLVASRLPVGLAKQTVAAARSILADCVPRHELTGMSARLTSFFAVGYAIGPYVGGALGKHYGDELPAFLAAAIFLALIPLTVFFLPETNPILMKEHTYTHNKRNTDNKHASALGGGAKGEAAVETVTRGGQEREVVRRRIRELVALLMLPEFVVVS